MATPINWHEGLIAQRLIARLHTGNVERQTRTAIPADYWVYVGRDRWAVDAITALNLIREIAVEESVGFRAVDARNGEQMGAYLDTDERAPNVTEVLEMAFAARAAGRRVAA
jgi:hypothetical protein